MSVTATEPKIGEKPKKLDKQQSRDHAAKLRIDKALKGFSKKVPAGVNVWNFEPSRPPTRDFPVPELVLFLFRNLMGWSWTGVGEKVRWTVYGSVAGEAIAFELRKFGFTILRMPGSKISVNRIVGQLHAALREVEKLLEPFAEQQVKLGDVLIVNRSGEFDGRYRFFRTRAEKAYARAKRPPKSKKPLLKGELPNFADALNFMHQANHEGFIYSTAMVDSYFSALEHRLVLLRAFSGQPLAEGGLVELLKSDWNEKLKLVLSPIGCSAGELLGRLRRIKERIRNPFAHGGVENDGGSLFFHLPHIGALPANFSKFGDSIRFSFIPIEADDHAEVCGTFDKLDQLLKSGPLAGPNRLLEAGVDPSFDSTSLKTYAESVAGGNEKLEEFIHRWGDAWMRHANMDY